MWNFSNVQQIKCSELCAIDHSVDVLWSYSAPYFYSWDLKVTLHEYTQHAIHNNPYLCLNKCLLQPHICLFETGRLYFF